MTQSSVKAEALQLGDRFYDTFEGYVTVDNISTDGFEISVDWQYGTIFLAPDQIVSVRRP